MNTYDKILSFQNDIGKQLYEDSVRQRNQINSKFTPTLTILSAEIGGVIWAIMKLVDSISGIVTIHQLCIFLFVSITSVLLGIALVHYIMCFTRYTFTYPSPEKVMAYIQENIQYLDEYSEEELLDNIVQNISKDYINMAINNNQETNKHSAHLNRCYIFETVKNFV